MEKKTFVVIGAGPGLGNHIAKEFASHGFRIVLASRSEAKLKDYCLEFRQQGFNDVSYAVLDCSDNTSIQNALRTIGHVDVLVYNPAVMAGKGPFAMSPQELLDRYQTDVAGALCAVQEVVPAMRKKNDGAILFTGGGLALSPMAAAASMSMHKAALRNLALLLNEDLKKDNIYCGIVNIRGMVGGSEHYAPGTIAKLYYQLYEKRDQAEITY